MLASCPRGCSSISPSSSSSFLSPVSCIMTELIRLELDRPDILVETARRGNLGAGFLNERNQIDWMDLKWRANGLCVKK